MHKLGLTVDGSVDEHIREHVAYAIRHGTIVDAPYESAEIVRAHQSQVTAQDVAMRLAKAAVAAQVPVYMGRSDPPPPPT